MRVVLTGGAGFIGANLAHHWNRTHPDDKVIVVDSLTYAGHRESLAALEGKPNFEFVQGDIRNQRDMEAVLKGTDLVLHLAAETHNDRAIPDPLPFVRTNVEGTAVLLEACRRLDIPRFHHVSTDEVFGSLALGIDQKFTERSPYQPRGPYSASKAAADHMVRAWAETYGLPVTLSNCGNNYGPYQHPEKLIPLATIRLLRGGTVSLYGDGRNVRDWIHVQDHCEAIDVIAHRGRLGSTYLVSAGNELSNNEIVARLLKLLGKDARSVQYVADRPGHDLRYALDSSRLRDDLGWKARVPFETGLRLTVEWYQHNETWWSPLVSGPKADENPSGNRLASNRNRDGPPRASTPPGEARGHGKTDVARRRSH